MAGGAFGRLYERDVDGGIVAQPLVVHGAPTAGQGRRDLLRWPPRPTGLRLRFDDNQPRPATPTGRQAAAATERAGGPGDCGETPSQRVGITGTPVVDAATRTLYAVARNAADHQYYLHALDLTADLVDRRPPVRIAPVDPQRREVRFNADCQRNRPALLLLNGVIYVAFGSLACDRDCPDGGLYRGWIARDCADDLVEVAVLSTGADRWPCWIGQAGQRPRWVLAIASTS